MDGRFLLTGFVLDDFGFLRLATFFEPGAESGGRIDTPGIVIGVIENAMISSISVITILYSNGLK